MQKIFVQMDNVQKYCVSKIFMCKIFMQKIFCPIQCREIFHQVFHFHTFDFYTLLHTYIYIYIYIYWRSGKFHLNKLSAYKFLWRLIFVTVGQRRKVNNRKCFADVLVKYFHVFNFLLLSIITENLLIAKISRSSICICSHTFLVFCNV